MTFMGGKQTAHSLLFFNGDFPREQNSGMSIKANTRKGLLTLHYTTMCCLTYISTIIWAIKRLFFSKKQCCKIYNRRRFKHWLIRRICYILNYMKPLLFVYYKVWTSRRHRFLLKGMHFSNPKNYTREK